jgi:Clp amino terminal domain, pathogenicity island component
MTLRIVTSLSSACGDETPASTASDAPDSRVCAGLVTNAADRLRELVEHTVRAGDPRAALRAMTALSQELEAFERLQVARALDAGESFGGVGRALGISRQAAHRRYRDLVGVSLPDPEPGPKGSSGRILVTSEARTAVNLAREEASALGARTVGSEHLLLGILRSRGTTAMRALEAAGVTLAAARLCAQPTLVDGVPPPPPPAPVAKGPKGISAYARAVFEQSLREAVRRGDGYIGVEHLLLASLEDPKGGACRTLCDLGLDPENVRAKLAV